MDAAKDASRAAFEAHLLAWTGRDAAYHELHATTGLGFAWSCWRAGAAAERERCIEAIEGNFDGSSYGLPPRIAALIVERINQGASVTGPLPAELRASIDQSILEDRLDGLVPADHRTWTEANGFVPLTPATLARIDALIGDVAVDLDAPLDPKDD